MKKNTPHHQSEDKAMTTTQTDHDNALTNHAAAIKKRDEIAEALAAAERGQAQLLGSVDDQLDDPQAATKLATAQVTASGNVHAAKLMLDAADRRVREAAFACLPDIAKSYRDEEAAAEKDMTAWLAKKERLLAALCEHTETEDWRLSVVANRSNSHGEHLIEVRRVHSARSARIVELVIEGREAELQAALADPTSSRFWVVLGGYTYDPAYTGVGHPDPRSVIPQELQAGGIYPLTPQPHDLGLPKAG